MGQILLYCYFAAALSLMAFGINCYVMIWLYKRRYQAQKKQRQETFEEYRNILPKSLPKVTTQIPIYNEYNVAIRIIRAVCKIDYPQDKHQIQILDDSNDETSDIVDSEVARQQKLGHDIVVIRRETRQGFKAGALGAGLEQATGELIAVFDADFIPPLDFLLKSVPWFMQSPQLGLVQARWGHLNTNSSLLTRAQSLGIDGHFMIEQSARSWNELFMNFNGTAGLWRKQAIVDGGGWHWDTLTEDMDLSYRVQLAGWTTQYLPDLVVPAELPEDIIALKNQQFRWAKGSIQTAIKLLPNIMRSNAGLFKKVQSIFHLTHYLVHPLMITMAVLAWPVLISGEFALTPVLITILTGILVLATLAPNTLYILSQREAYGKKGYRRLLVLPGLIIVGVGLAVNNTRAVLEAVLGKESPFVRTPKKGSRELKSYRVRLPKLVILEITLGLYCAMALQSYVIEKKYLVGPFLAIYASGFLFVGFLSLIHYMNWNSPIRLFKLKGQ